MSDRKLQDSLSNLESAVSNLERALALPTDQDLVLEGTIHRFEIVAELTWKTVKRALEFEGLSPKTPRDSLKEAFRIGWLKDEAAWLDMLDYRNTTSHVYLADELVEKAYANIKALAPVIRSALDFLKERYATRAGDTPT